MTIFLIVGILLLLFCVVAGVLILAGGTIHRINKEEEELIKRQICMMVNKWD